MEVSTVPLPPRLLTPVPPWPTLKGVVRFERLVMSLLAPLAARVVSVGWTWSAFAAVVVLPADWVPLVWMSAAVEERPVRPLKLVPVATPMFGVVRVGDALRAKSRVTKPVVAMVLSLLPVATVGAVATTVAARWGMVTVAVRPPVPVAGVLMLRPE